MIDSRLLRFMLAMLLAAAAAGPAAGQYYNPYYPQPYNIYGRNQGSTYAGAAQVIQAQNQTGLAQEQQRIQRQKYYQEKLNTKRQAFDEAAYEKANTPTYVENLSKSMSQKIQRIMISPAPAEITRGDTLNTLLPFLKALGDQGTQGPPMSISPSILAAINVATPNSAGGGTSVGVLKNGGKLSWPLMLRGPMQKKIDALLPSAVSEAKKGTLEASTYTKLVGLVQSMKDDTRKKYHKEQIDGSTYLSNNRYLNDLQSSLKVLTKADAAKYLGGDFTARGGNVQELVDNMTADGLKFAAPATPGAEAAYFSLNNSFVSYARAAQNGGGFQSQFPQPTSNYNKGLKPR